MKQVNKTEFKPQTLIDVVEWHSKHNPNKVVYTFLPDGEEEAERLSFADLEKRSKQIGTLLAESGLNGERALLLYQPSLDYLAAFLGCLFAGVVAVPAYPPRNNRNLGRVQSIIDDAQAKVALTSESLLHKITSMFSTVEGLKNVTLLTTDSDLGGYEEKWAPPHVSGDYLAFLQYTSGSTGNPKGVMLSHNNLLHNLSTIHEAYSITPDSKGVIWLPPYHDMGLIGGLLETLYAGAHTIYMPPAAFLQRPMRMLETITKYKAQVSGGPNFTYDILVNKSTPEQREHLDLSSWQVAFNGAEPVRWETLDRFATTFEPYGFDRKALLPCYGLAESSVFVCSSRIDKLPVVKKFDKKALEHNKLVLSDDEKNGRVLVGSGHFSGDQVVKIVDPETCLEVANGEMGEVWIKGRSISRGYWNRQEESEKTFQNYIADTKEGPFLRTEDRGFLMGDELFITGRIKDLIIIRGVNHYPQDIERTVEVCHPALRLGGGAAFSVEVGDEEKLVIAHELEFRQNPEIREVAAAMREAVAENHDLQLYALVLVKPGRIPKTSSGKIQRYAARQGYLDDTLDKVDIWHADDQAMQAPQIPSRAETTERPTPKSPRLKEIERWIVAKISKELNIAAADIDVSQPFARYGLDSARATGLAGDLEEWLGRPVSATLAYDYPTIEALSRYLSDEDNIQESAAIQNSDKHENIAIIGMGCRFPGAQNVREFWKLLVDGVDAISEVTKDRWDIDELYDPEPGVPGKVVTKSGGFIQDVDKFDAQFFGISPREANRMDPQQRLAMEVSWETLEDAGYAPSSLSGSVTGVYIGVSNNDYANLLNGDIKNIDTYTGTGNAFSIVANRLSYFYDFRGPSMALDTACSSSLVAIHQAVRSLRAGEINLALAGGVNLVLSPEITVTFSHARLMSPDGRCKTFDADANGYSRGEGCGFLALKRLSDAERDGDRIYAIIRGSAVNQDGRSNGITAPNGLAQQDVIRKALQDANVEAKDIDYIETHGTGTILGDPIEVKAIAAVMRDRTKDNPCLIGSVKTNIGHLESAAGVAGVIKTALALNHQLIPSHLFFKKINPHIPINEMPIEIVSRSRPWSVKTKPRRAGISSFGFGGTNSHIILEEAQAVTLDTNNVDRTAHIITLSSKSEKGLNDQARSMFHFLESTTEEIADICYTGNTARDHFKHRLAIVGTDRHDFQTKMSGILENQVLSNGFAGSSQFAAHKVAFLFTGQGSQYINMGKSLYETNKVFKRALDQCDQISRAVLDKPILSIIYNNDNDPLINQTIYTQPAIFAIEYALAEVWQEWGIFPDYVMGHSIGELVAAYYAGVFSLEDAFKLVAARGRLMGSLPTGGKMAAIFADIPTVTAKISQYNSVDIAGVNGPQTIVISGTHHEIDAILDQFQAQEIQVRELVVSHAFHSAAMDPILDEFEKIASEIEYKKPQIPIVSNVTGTVQENIPDAAYWRSHIRNTVQFYAGISTLRDVGCDVFVEPGPNPHLIGMGRRSMPTYNAIWVGSLKSSEDDWSYLLKSVAQLYVNGLNIDWQAFDQSYSRLKVRIPTYAFQRQRYWLQPRETDLVQKSDNGRVQGQKVHPLLGYELPSPLATIQFQNKINGNLDTYLHDFSLSNSPVLPSSAFVEMGLSAGRRALKDEHVALKNVKFHSDLLLKASGTQIQFLVTPESREEANFKAYSLEEQTDEKIWILHAEGTIVHEEQTEYQGPETSIPMLLKQTQKADMKDYYQRLETGGLCLGNNSPILGEIFLGENMALAKVNVPEDILPEIDNYQIHPMFLDACCQTIALTLQNSSDILIADGFERQINYQQNYSDVWCIATTDSVANDHVIADAYLVNRNGSVIHLIKRARFKRVNAAEKNIYKASTEHNVKSESEVKQPDSGVSLTKDELMSADAAHRGDMLAVFIQKQLAAILGMHPEQLDLKQPVTNFGLDSIMAVELQVKLERAWSFKLPVARLIVGPTIEELCEFILQELEKHDESALIKASTEPEYGLFPLSKGQEAMWVQHQMAPKSIYNPVYAVRIRSAIDLDVLHNALQIIVNRHPSLRTTFHFKGGEQIQHVHEHMDVLFDIEDVAQLDNKAVQKRIEVLANEPYDLTKGPLFRTTVLERSKQHSILVIAAHHIVMDMWSLAIIVNEISQLYLNTDVNFTFLPLRYRYTDYVAWQNELLQNSAGEKMFSYWAKKLAGSLPVLELPTDFARPPVQTFNGKIRSLKLGLELTDKVKKLSDARGVTLYMTLLAAFKILLYKYTGQDDIIVGTPTTGRSRSEFSDIVGYFVNPVALRSFVKRHVSFTEFLTDVQQTVVGALEHQDYPFYQLVEKLAPARDASRTPIFQTMFVYQRAHVLDNEGLSSISLGIEGEEMTFAGHPISVLPIEDQVSPFDMTWMIAEAKDGLAASLTFNTDLYHEETVLRLLDQYKTLLESIVEQPEAHIAHLQVVPYSELYQVLFGWNDTHVPLPKSPCIQNLFEEQVRRHPEAIAVHFEDQDLSYGQLDAMANQLGHYLQQRGVGAETIVGLCVERSLETVVGLLGILKAGGAYLPLDPHYPKERLRYMIEHSHVRNVITLSDLRENLPDFDGTYIYLDLEKQAVAEQSRTCPNITTGKKNLAYIIYTSGSTGQPKGVMLTQEGLINLVQAQIKIFDVRPDSRVLQYASFSFDASVSEIFMALISGATLYMISRETMLSQKGLLEALKNNAITTVTLPPSILAVLPEAELPELETIISAGEACTKNTVNRWKKGRRFINAYGPTESTVCTTANVIDGEIHSDNIPIGTAIDNLRLYIVDQEMNPVPIGVPGELLIGGIGVARGYFDRPDLTASKFIPNPWADTPGERLYRSGDLVRYLVDGKIEFLGRIDHQVKIRGLRVELGEIESTILKHPDIKNAVVLARRVKTGETRLAAYYLSNDNQDISYVSLSSFMKKKLPPYMVPSAFMRMDDFPLTQNKKIDRRAFPDPFFKQQLNRTDIVKPKNDIERTIAEAWRKVLNIKQVSIHDNFFEIGGHSLMMVKLHAILEESLNTKLSVVELFQYPTIASQAKFLSTSKKESMAIRNVEMRAVRQRNKIQAQRDRYSKAKNGERYGSRNYARLSKTIEEYKGT